MFWDELSFQPQDLSNKVALVTGANIGLGFETVKFLVEMNAKVYIACRNIDKAKKAKEEIFKVTGKQVEILHLDLTRFSTVRECAAKFLEAEQTLDILVNNAGMVSANLKITEDGLETTVQCNHFSPTLLTLLLLPALKRSSASRVVNVASDGYKFGTFDLDNFKGLSYNNNFSTMHVYGTSKLYYVLITQAWARRLKDSPITFVATHPGFVDTDIGKKDEIKGLWFYRWIAPFITLFTWLFSRSSRNGAKTTVHAAVDPSVNQSGDYYVSCKKVSPKINLPEGSADQVWEKTLEILDWKDSV